jgi:beta-N-acetylhexosaminidase
MSDLERAVARMFCVGFAGTSIPVEMRQLIDRGVGGAVLFRRNFTDAQQFADLCSELKCHAGRPFFSSIDQEGGRVIRLGAPFTQVPSMRTIGLTGDAELARQIGALLAKELRAANVDMDFAPVLDVDTNPANPVIADRSFGRTPELVSKMGLALIDGLQQEGVAACGKHFPGHGDTSQDSHLDLPRLPHGMERLNEVELPPFAAAARAGVTAIMTAHVVFEAIDPDSPATMSRAVLTGLLRERLGFEGVIVSDDLEMKAIANHYKLEEVIVRSANAGVDLFSICYTPATQNEAIDVLVRAVERGDVARETIDTAGRRLDRLCAKFVRPARIGPISGVIGCLEHQSLVERFSRAESTRDPTEYRNGVVAEATMPD